MNIVYLKLTTHSGDVKWINIQHIEVINEKKEGCQLSMRYSDDLLVKESVEQLKDAPRMVF